MSSSVRPQRGQPTRLPRPWDSPGKSTGVGCHFLLQCMKVKSESEVAQSCPTPSDPMDCSLPGSSVLHTHKTAPLFIAKSVYLTFKMQFNHFSKKSLLNIGQWPFLFSLLWYIVNHIIFYVSSGIDCELPERTGSFFHTLSTLHCY